MDYLPPLCRLPCPLAYVVHSNQEACALTDVTDTLLIWATTMLRSALDPLVEFVRPKASCSRKTRDSAKGLFKIFCCASRGNILPRNPPQILPFEPKMGGHSLNQGV